MVKKLHPRFRVPNLGAKKRKRVIDRWRKQRGIDNKMRVEIKGHGASPKVGYKNSAEERFARSDGMREVLVRNERELLEMAKLRDTHVAVFAHDLSRRSRSVLKQVAEMNGIRVANAR